ncbi:MAG: carboxypeptidase regulatory-like domain-containing protein, partial [Deltaproteobacteria bacterium]|nr:carboxypeptidase regulatory-like domain-containing protein [Deltaproteobacteria bacterium]
MARRSRIDRFGLALLIGAPILLVGCPPPERASAYRIEGREQLIGGPGALGDVNDYMLENGRIRVIVQDIGYSRGFGVFGGGIIDADLVRPRKTGTSAGSGGNDLFGEMFPAFFLEALDPKTIEIVDDGSQGGAATIRVKGRGNEFLAMTEMMMTAVLGPENLLFETDYSLAPGKNYVEITSRVINNDPRGRSHQFHNIEFSGISVPIPMGDAILFSYKTPTFVPGDGGYDQRLFMEERYKLPIQLPAIPGLVSEYVAASGDGVSYAFLPAPAGDANFIHKHIDIYGSYAGTPTDHSLVIPFSASSLTPAFFANPPDLLGPDEVFTFSRYLIVGSGDVATVANTVHEILGDETGTFSGRVRELPSLTPVAGASVIVFDGNRQPINQLTTDAAGYFRGAMRPGTYSATVVLEKRQTPVPRPFAVEVGGR